MSKKQIGRGDDVYKGYSRKIKNNSRGNRFETKLYLQMGWIKLVEKENLEATHPEEKVIGKQLTLTADKSIEDLTIVNKEDV